MPQKLVSVDVDVAECYLKMARDVALGAVSERDNFKGAIGAVVVCQGDVLGEGQAHLKEGENVSPNGKALKKAEQRAIWSALANVKSPEEIKGSHLYVSPILPDKSGAYFQLDDFLENCSYTSLKTGIVGWVMPYDGVIYRFARRELK